MATTYNIDSKYGIYSLYNATSKSVMNGLTDAQKKKNADFIYKYLHTYYNWTVNAVAGMLGNVEAESKLNAANIESDSTNNAVANKWYPGYPGSGSTTDAPNPTNRKYGIGLWQVTPWRSAEGRRYYSPYNYGEWASAKGYTFSYSTGGTGLSIIPQLIWFGEGNPSKDYTNSGGYQTRKFDQWSDIGNYSGAIRGLDTVEKFAASTESAYNLAITFYANFERSKAQNAGSRGTNGQKWYNYLTSSTADPDIPGKEDPGGESGESGEDEPDNPGDVTTKFILPVRRRRRNGRTILF